MTQTCTTCSVEKPLVEFYTDKTKKSGHHGTCKECVKADRKRRYAENPAIYAERHKRWYEANKEHVFEYARKRRREAIEAYGGACSCCGVTEYEFLTFDHVDGWGAEHRKTIGEGATVIVNWLKKNGYPKDVIRLLCWNCNCSRGQYGYCPHETVKSTLALPDNRVV